MTGQRTGDDGVAEPVRRGSVQAERDVNGRYRWSLKAPNGRIVAVSPPVHESAEQARRVFEGLRGAAPGLTVRITHVRDGIGWIWVVPGARGVPEARSHRTYERYATCQNAFRRFVALLERPAGVDVPAGVEVVAGIERLAGKERPVGAELPAVRDEF